MIPTWPPEGHEIQHQEERIMKKKGLYAFGLLLAIVICLFVLSPSAVQAQQKPVELRLSHIWPPGSPQDVLFAQYAKRVETGTNGKVKIVIYPANTLCPPTEVWNAIKSGAVDIGCTFANYHRSGFEFNNAHLNFWIGSPNIEFAAKYMDRFREKYPALKKEFADAKVLWFGHQGPRQLLTAKKAIRKVDDLKGVSIRPASPPEAEMVKGFGAIAPSFMPMSEVYTSLQKGIIGGLWVSVEALKSHRLADVVKYVTRMNFEVGQNKYVAMNWNVWNKLPPDVQKVFEKESAWAKVEDMKVWTNLDIEAEKFAKAQGVEFIDFSPAEHAKEMAVVAPIQDSVAKAWDAKGYPASALLKDIRQAIKAGK
jgi:TRAP-type C4-dicarboxylate transport system substrate-binding protein